MESVVLTTLVRPHATPALVERLVRSGASGVRLIAKGFSPAEYRERYEALLVAGAAASPDFRVIVDLPGGKPRISSMIEDFEVERGTLLLLHDDGDAPTRDHRRPLATVGLMRFAGDLAIGDRVFVADGTVEMKIVSLGKRTVTVEVQSERSVITASRSINLPDSGVRYPSHGNDDRVLTAFDAEQAVEVAVSMTASPEDVERVRRVLPRARVIAKIESAAGLLCLEEIAGVADELLIARGDLSLELPLAELGIAAQQIAAMAEALGRPCVLAAGFLDTLQRADRPSVAEVSDLWHQHQAGIGTFMLSGTVCVTRPLEVTRWACALLGSFDDRRAAARAQTSGHSSG